MHPQSTESTTTEPKLPEGTPEHAAYAAELRTELGKFARGKTPYEYPATGPQNREIKARYLTPGMRVQIHPLGELRTVAAVNQDGDTVHVRYVDTAALPYGVEEAVTVVGDAPEPAAEPDSSRQRLAAELHRIADDITHTDLPLGWHASLHLGVLASRADLARWAGHLGHLIQVSNNGIPSISHEVNLGDRNVLTISVQSRREDRSEVERLRARVAELEAQAAEGGEPR